MLIIFIKKNIIMKATKISIIPFVKDEAMLNTTKRLCLKEYIPYWKIDIVEIIKVTMLPPIHKSKAIFFKKTVFSLLSSSILSIIRMVTPIIKASKLLIKINDVDKK